MSLTLTALEAATYVVRYKDGMEQRVPVRVGLGILDWYVAPRPLPGVQVAWTGHSDDRPGPGLQPGA